MTSTIKVDTISEKTSANGVAIDSVTLKDGGVTATAASTITVADNSDTLSLISTDADAAIGPNLRLYRNSSSPADDDLTATVDFEWRNDNSQDVIGFQIDNFCRDVSDGAEENIIRFKNMFNGTLTEFMRADSQSDQSVVTFNELSNDIDFRVESNSNTHMLFVDGGNNRVGVFSEPDLGSGLHIRTADSSASVNGDGDELVIEHSGNAGLSILTGTSNVGSIFFGDSGDNDRGGIQYNHSTNHLSLYADAEDPCLTVHNAQIVSMGVTETAPDVAAGLCINQGASDSNILSFKSSDVAHGHTSTADADTYFITGKKSSSNGGVVMKGFTDTGDGHAFEITGVQESSNTAESTSASSSVSVNGFRREGGTTNTEAIPTSANVFGIKNADDMQCLFKGDGEIHTNTAGTSNTGSVSTFDEYDDAQLVRAFDLSKGHYARGLIDSQFDKFVKYNIQDLVDAKLIGTEEDGTPNNFVNMTGFQRLHNGAIWQQYEKHQRLAEAVYEMAKEALGEDKADAILEKHDIKLLN